MPLLINKDGQQLGPYSLEEARALVLSGKLEVTDWAWPDGATQWIHLKDVPGFSPAASGVAPDQPPAPPTAAHGEQELWSGHPSQMLNFHVYFIWAIVLLAVLAAGMIIPVVLIGFGVLTIISLGHIAVDYLRLRAIRYVVTTQRVRVVSGLFSKEIQEIELFRVKDTMVHQPFFLRLFGLGIITIISGDQSHPQITLYAVPGAFDLRERLRQEVMTLRQRFGVRELDVM